MAADRRKTQQRLIVTYKRFNGKALFIQDGIVVGKGNGPAARKRNR